MHERERERERARERERERSDMKPEIVKNPAFCNNLLSCELIFSRRPALLPKVGVPNNLILSQ